jgi:hypothetical protein
MLIGWLTPLLIVMHVIPSTFFPNFLSWGASMAGLFLGFVGGAMYVRGDRDE